MVFDFVVAGIPFEVFIIEALVQNVPVAVYIRDVLDVVVDVEIMVI